MELPRWKCHKEVEGFQIDRIVGNSLISSDAQVFVIVSDEYMARCAPFAGGYFVRYSNGHESFSPAQAFEDGYSKGTRKRILHIQVGSDDWSPSIEDMQAVMEMFMAAADDPKGGVVVTNRDLVHSEFEDRGRTDDLSLVHCSVYGFRPERSLKLVEKVEESNVVNLPEWHTVEIFPEGKVLMVESYKNHLFLNNVQGATRLIRGRAVNRIVLHSLSKEDLVPDVRAALECAVFTYGNQIKPVEFEYQP